MKRLSLVLGSAIAALLCVELSPVAAQQPNPDPNRDRFIQPPEEPFPEPIETDPILPVPETVPTPIEGEETTFVVEKIEVLGSTVFTEADFAPILEPLEGRSVTLGELKRAIAAINQLYLNAGYINSTAVLPDQEIRGAIQIQVIEGKLSEVEVEGTRYLNPEYARSRVNLGSTFPLQSTPLEDQLRLLRANPLFDSVNAYLRPGEADGETVLVVEVDEARRIGGELAVNNYSPPSIGSMRASASIFTRNLTGLGETWSVAFHRSTTGGSRIGDFGFQMPLNPMEGTLGLRAVIDKNEITQSPFDEFDIDGSSGLYEINFRQPLIRTPREEFALSVGFSYKDGQTFVFDQPTPFGIGPEADGSSTTSVFRFGQDYTLRDVSGAWAFRSQFNFGVGILGATTNESPTPDSRFFSWLGQVQRVQRLSPNNLLLVQGSLQLASDSLLPSQQFVIGGGQSVRGFRQNARSGDNGFRFSIEDRITLVSNELGESVVQLAPFFDMGTVWNRSGNPNTLPSQRFIAGIGSGILWSPLENLALRLDFTLPLVNVRDRGTSLQDDGFYFSASYRF
ncbi:ShlB/FhaC/HecB family hemolysin secretion/activation protein [Lusitaniella coriacea LEGE 07157]|uniref:ShlB/FhaC/HecB family hemolysin secretion/activation protein n=1 Tax=Lusitaniella coriacea LEGE 07157 TaxID=945747 RepID=A0A8J7IWM6_9CYAN|nr:ShlB/FhaC/HecB family hemolysin secretion/activation protein [Lusitaniella coriacea]MBE9118153.1 ShlB/FhaC/HecB family hemolysin secretion/activation protein [Lusitaniella coriacea LEGE 07157]